MRTLSAAFLALTFSAVVARAEWTILSSSAETAGAAKVEHRHVVVQSKGEGSEARLDLAIFSSKTATLRVIDDPSEGHARLAETMQREGCFAGVNGGYFDPDYAPVGLLLSDGRMISPLRKARLLSGVLSVVNGRVQIQRSSEFSMKAKPSAARQSGPFLIDHGKPIAGLNDTRSARRTFCAMISDTQAAIGFSSRVTLAQLAAILTTRGMAGELAIQRALNLDGGSSSGFWFAGENGVSSIREQKMVRDYIGIAPK